MDEYANVRRKDIKRFLNWLKNHKQVEVEEGTKHTRVTCIHNGDSTLAPARHSDVDPNLVRALVKWLIANEICTKEECDSHL